MRYEGIYEKYETITFEFDDDEARRTQTGGKGQGRVFQNKETDCEEKSERIKEAFT